MSPHGNSIRWTGGVWKSSCAKPVAWYSRPAKTKHMILLSDGNTAPPGRLTAETSSSAAMALIRKERGLAPEQEFDKDLASGGVDELAARFAHANITLSTVAIGENPNVELM